MSSHVGEAIAAAVDYLSQHPEDARATDAAATAVVNGLRATVTGPSGATLTSDMPEGVGGEASSPTPGWLLRAALASCDATVIAMRAASEGVDLDTLEVTVDSDSDDRGLLGIDDAVPAGPLRVRVTVRIAAAGESEARLRDIVDWAEAHSPVGDAIRRAVPASVEVLIAGRSGKPRDL